MPSTSGAIRAGGAFVEIMADDSALKKTLSGTESFVKKWSKAFGNLSLGLGITSFGLMAPATGMLALVKSMAQNGADLALMSQRTGIAVDQLSDLKYAAKQAGVGMDDLEASTKRMQRAIGDAAIGLQGVGGSTAAKALADLKLNAKELAALPTDQQLLKIGDALAKIGNIDARSALSQAIFGQHGQGGTSLLPLFAAGPSGASLASDLMAQARTTGLNVSSSDASNALAFTRAWDLLSAAASRVGLAFGSVLMPPLARTMTVIAKLTPEILSFISTNKKLILGVAGGAAALAGLGIAGLAVNGIFIGLTTILGVAGLAVNLFAIGFAAVSAIFGIVAAAASVAVGAIMGFGAVGATIGLIVVAIGGLLLHIFDVGKAFNYIGGIMGDVGKFIGKQFAVVWQVIQFIGDNASTPAQAVSDAFEGAKDGIVLMWNEMLDSLTSLWIDFAGWFKQLWYSVLGWVTSEIRKWVSFVAGFAKDLHIAGALGMPDFQADIAALDALKKDFDDDAAAAKDFKDWHDNPSNQTSSATMAAAAAVEALKAAILGQSGGTTGKESLAEQLANLIKNLTGFGAAPNGDNNSPGGGAARAFGTFDPFMAEFMGPHKSAQEQQAEQQKKIEENTRKTHEAVERLDNVIRSRGLKWG